MRFCPAELILLDRAENALFEIEQELKHTWVGATLTACVADICDARRIESIFAEERPQVVFHCAAHKHVPMMEANAGEAIKNNVFGTRTVAEAAARHDVGAFVLVSTDKAVNPTSVMGATKRVAELFVQSLNDHCKTRFVAVRFGNVLGSSGSVVPIFQKQIEAGGPVTVTHPDMRRYFMTIPEASQLVMQAGAIGKGGEIFVLDMGDPVKISDLAADLIRLSGFEVGRDIDITFSGIRPGEKLYEELSNSDERTRPTSHEKIRVWELPRADQAEIDRILEVLSSAVNASTAQVTHALQHCVPEYAPTPKVLRHPLAGTQADSLLRMVGAAAA
jgi:FlaA1/EpsC-like NDP-sugar epimerase